MKKKTKAYSLIFQKIINKRMLGWNLMVIILLTNTHKVVNRIINNHSKNFKRNPEEQFQHWNQQNLILGNRLKRINPETTLGNLEVPEAWSIKKNAGYFEIENKDRKADRDIEAAPVEEDWYIETSTTNVNSPSNVVKISVGDMGSQFPRIRSFRNPAKRQKQINYERDSNIKHDTWMHDKYQGQFLDEVPGRVLSRDPVKIHEGGPWTKRHPVKLATSELHPVKRVTGGMHPVKRVTGGMHPVKRVTGGMPAVCVPVKKKVYKCRTIKYRGRGITYCWYENEDQEDCASLD